MNNIILQAFTDYIKAKPKEFPEVRISQVVQYPDGLVICQLMSGDYNGGIILYDDGKFERFGPFDRNLAKRIGNRSLNDFTFLYNENESS